MLLGHLLTMAFKVLAWLLCEACLHAVAACATERSGDNRPTHGILRHVRMPCCLANLSQCCALQLCPSLALTVVLSCAETGGLTCACHAEHSSQPSGAGTHAEMGGAIADHAAAAVDALLNGCLLRSSSTSQHRWFADRRIPATQLIMLDRMVSQEIGAAPQRDEPSTSWAQAQFWTREQPRTSTTAISSQQAGLAGEKQSRYETDFQVRETVQVNSTSWLPLAW